MFFAPFRKPLEDWYQASARDLPWRQTSDPYAIWISEIMLQQTQVKTVIPRYLAWMHMFPDVETLASATEDQVMKMWEGLGYYRRAAMIHRSADTIVHTHDGCFPHAFDAMLALPGIGRSTAGAIASIALGQGYPLLDGNVKRVLGRWKSDSNAKDTDMWAWANAAISHASDAGNWNQAMMELGATLCTPKHADCQYCPVASCCQSAFNALMQTPQTKRRVRVLEEHWKVVFFVENDRILLKKRPKSGIWSNLWTPPIDVLKEIPDTQAIYMHQLTHRKLFLHADFSSARPESTGTMVPFSQLQEYSIPTGIRKMMDRMETFS